MLGTHANRHYTDHERRSVMRSRLAIGVCFAGLCDEKFESEIEKMGNLVLQFIEKPQTCTMYLFA